MLTRGRVQKWLTDVLWQRRALERADALVVATREEGDLIQPLGLPTPVATVPLGLDLGAFSAASVSRSEPEVPIIINHGRLAPKKSLEVLVDALPIIHGTIRGARLCIIGPDPHGLGRDLSARAAGLGVGDFVDIPGPMYGPELAATVASASIWVLPSASENFGVAVVEAMAAGVPVIVSSAVNIAAAAAEAGACRIASRDAVSVARVTLELLASSAARRALTAGGQRFAATYSTEVAAEALCGAYLDAFSHRRGAG
jgi:glycosyltransferase involved in cell wall biosynthesis